jgi:hypothetical protein
MGAKRNEQVWPKLADCCRSAFRRATQKSGRSRRVSLSNRIHAQSPQNLVDQAVPIFLRQGRKPEQQSVVHRANNRIDEQLWIRVTGELARTLPALDVGGWARKGHGGEDGADPGAVGWISFRLCTARPTLAVQDGEGGQTYIFDAPVAGDPHMHIHNFLMNLVVTADGRAGSLDSRRLTDARVKEFGAYFQAVLAKELRALGVRVAYDATEQAVVIPAIPDHVVQAFSKRDRQILHKAKRFAEGQGLNWDELSADSKLGIIEEASADGRLGKIKADEKRLWRKQAEALGWKHTTAMEDAVYPTLSKAERHERSYEFAARHLEVEFHTAAVIDHEKLGMYAARGLIGTGLDGADDIAKVVELLETRGIRLKGEHVALVVGMSDQKVRVTNTAQILATTAEELRIRTNAGDAADVEWRRLAADQAGGPTSRAGQGVAGQPGGAPTGRLLLGFGHALTIDVAQGITSDEHINALPRGTAGVTGFTTYVAESRRRGTTWTVVSDGALYEAEHHGRALGDITPITTEHLWDRNVSMTLIQLLV